MNKFRALTVGMKVQIKPDFGSGPLVTGVITEIKEDIKNGYPGISYDVVGPDGKPTDDSRWAYMDQVL